MPPTGLPAILPRPPNRVRVNPFRSPNPSDSVSNGQANPRPEAPFASGQADRKLPRRTRLGAAFMALGLLVPLVLACWLEPDARGHGTHQQLGFPPCTLVALCGVRCPTCGMTTSWAAVVRGRLLDGLAANVGGVLLAVAAMVSIIALSSIAVLGHRPWWFPDTNGLAWIAMAIAAVTLIDWLVRTLLL